jgi:uncharacterized protein (DUF2267 family)
LNGTASTGEQAVDYEQFIKIVEEQTGLGAEAAERAAWATLRTLAERLSKGEARDLRGELPAEMKPWVYTEGDPDPFNVDEFLRRVAEREGVGIKQAERHARAVFWALGHAVSAEEIADLAADLPHDFAPLVAEAQKRYLEVVQAAEFVGRVAELAGLDPYRARRATEAVLEALAERIASGQVDDLIAQLPVQLHAPLRRGMAAGPGRAVRMPLDRFVQRIADREGVSPEEAREHARAVFTALRESIAAKEFFDVTAQLPKEYETLLPHP